MKRVIVTWLIVSFSAMTSHAATGFGLPPELPGPGNSSGPVRSGGTGIRAPLQLTEGGDAQSRSYGWLSDRRLATVSSQQNQQVYTSSQGFFDGQMHAERIGTGGNFAGGLACGFLLGLIGTGLVYFLTGPAEMDYRAMGATEGKGPDYRMGFEMGFKKKSRSRKRNAALGGGLVGSLIGIVLIASASS